MPIYIALLRGVNVGGNMLKMDRLRELCTKLGAKNAKTYVQSGNVVFDAQGDRIALGKRPRTKARRRVACPFP